MLYIASVVHFTKIIGISLNASHQKNIRSICFLMIQIFDISNGSAYDSGGGGIVWSLHDAKFLSFICSCIDHYMVQMVLSFIYTDWKCFLDLHAGKGWGGHDGIQKRHTVIVMAVRLNLSARIYSIFLSQQNSFSRLISRL